ncbi:MAG: CpsD/CapB family tyrosine-protein kinase [Clostridia bacterium]|nr:CpsD/CapB family tyrosine-protein kinase [Clostridia bacterium]
MAKIKLKLPGTLKQRKAKHRIENMKVGAEMDFSSSEAYNLLRTNVYFALPGKDSRVIGITSSSPREGKSYTSINFAYTLAKDGKRVLLIDGDMRKSSVARKLKMKNSPGFSNVLADPALDAIQRNILIENLDVLFAGDIPPNPSEMLGSERLKEFVAEKKAEYDYIIVDLPPVNVVPDALVLSSVLDGMIIVVRHNFTSKKALTESIKKLKFANVHILGCIYRGYSRKATYYKKRGSYYSHYYYYGGDDKE